MLETPHVAVGAAIAIKVGNPALALPLALASHFVLDKIPHWNPHFYTEAKNNGKPKSRSTYVVIADVVTALVLGLFIVFQQLPDTALALTVLFASFASVLPDLVKFPYYYLRVRTGLMKKWVDYERSLQVDTTFWPGMTTQLITILTALWWIS